MCSHTYSQEIHSSHLSNIKNTRLTVGPLFSRERNMMKPQMKPHCLQLSKKATTSCGNRLMHFLYFSLIDDDTQTQKRLRRWHSWWHNLMKQIQVHMILHYLGPNLAWHSIICTLQKLFQAPPPPPLCQGHPAFRPSGTPSSRRSPSKPYLPDRNWQIQPMSMGKTYPYPIILVG